MSLSVERSDVRDAAEESPCGRVHGSAENCDSTAYTARHSSQADRARHPASGPAVWPWRVGLTMSANAVETVLAVLDALDFRRLDAIVQM